MNLAVRIFLGASVSWENMESDRESTLVNRHSSNALPPISLLL